MNRSVFHRYTFGAALALVFLLSPSAFLHGKEKENVHEAAVRDSAIKLNEINRDIESAKGDEKKVKAIVEQARSHIMNIKAHVVGAELEKEAKDEINKAAEDAMLITTAGTINALDLAEFKKVTSNLVATIHKHFKVKFPKFIRKIF